METVASEQPGAHLVLFERAARVGVWRSEGGGAHERRAGTEASPSDRRVIALLGRLYAFEPRYDDATARAFRSALKLGFSVTDAYASLALQARLLLSFAPFKRR